MASVQIDLEVVTKAFENALDSSRKKTEEFSTQASKNFSAVGTAFNVMAGNLAANVVSKALGFVTDSISNLLHEAADSEKNVNDLNIALKQAGLFSEKTSTQFQDLANEIANTTTVDDDLVLKTESLLLSLTNLNQKGIEQATKRAVDLSAALGIDLSSATTLVSNAINGNTTALARMGIQVQKASDDQGRLNNLLLATDKFTGAAADKTRTYQGATEQQNVALGNLIAEFGFLITKNDAVISGIQNTTSYLQNLTTWVQNNQKEIKTFIESLKITVPVLATLGTVIGISTVGFTGLATAASAAWAAITGPVGIAVAAIASVTATVYALYKNWEIVKAGTYEALAAVLEYSAKAVALLSSDKAQALLTQAQAYRDQALAIREAKLSAEEKEKTDVAINQAAVLRAKQEAELAQATYDLKKELKLAEQEAKIADDAYELQRTDANFKLLVQQLGLEAAIHRQAEINITTDKIAQEKLRLQNQIDFNKKQIKDTNERHQKVLDAEKEHYANLQAGRLTYIAWEDQTEQQRISTTKETLGYIGGLTRSSNNELFEIGKAAAIAQATVDGYLAVQKALASLPPPFNFVAAALVGAATAANVSAISNQSKPKFADGGIVPGNSFVGDRVQASINSGEMILNKSQQSKLFRQINSDSSNNETNKLLSTLIDVIANQTQSIQIDGKEIVSVVRNQLASGRSLAQ